MHFYKLFANSIHKEPPFRNPYVYLKEDEFIKLQKQEEQSESKLLKEKREAENLMDNQIISALDNLSSAVASKKLNDTRKMLAKKKEDLIEAIFPIESNISNKETCSKDRRDRSSKENKRLFRFFMPHISKSTMNSCPTSLRTKDSSDSEYTDTTTATYSPKAMNKYGIIDTTNTSICSSVVALKSKDSTILSSGAVANIEHLLSREYSITSYNISHTENNNGNVNADDIYPTLGCSMSSLKTISLPLSLMHFPAGQEITTTSHIHYNNNPFVKTTYIADSFPNCSKNNYSIDDVSIGSFTLNSNDIGRSQNYDFPIAFVPNFKATNFYHTDRSIVLPKANYTNSQLSSFRRKYHRYSIVSDSFRHDSLCSYMSNESDMELRKLDHSTTGQSFERPENEILTFSLTSSDNKNIQYLNDIHYLNDSGYDYTHKHIEKFESSSVYDSESDNYCGQDKFDVIVR